MALRILFLGTPEFAVPTLQRLAAGPHIIVAVVTTPDKAANRGLRLQPSPVKQAALSLGLPVLQPNRLDEPHFLNTVTELQPDIGVVVAFRKLPRALWSLPKMGSINLHASLLPQYRGAAPIQRAIMAGESTTGLTTFFLDDELDTGQILLQQVVPIREDDTGGSLHDRMKILGAELVSTTLDLLEAGKCTPKPQPQWPDLKKAPKIKPEELLINFHQPVHAVHNHVRALAPVPAAYTIVNHERLKILRASTVLCAPMLPAGSPCTDNSGRLLFACTDGYLVALEVQRPGRRPLPVDAFLRGWNYRSLLPVISVAQ
ncbi:MAG: methionyl-tRNA formyltransferase [Chitinophagales bacterium]|nr:methionyl-tRNA formyltransferase [Chitinophagales bacterium]MDW8428800.1 methionyl-tRNA formyltransferase [Chitinophagales bacterium]